MRQMCKWLHIVSSTSSLCSYYNCWNSCRTEESEEEGEGEGDASGAATPGEGLVTPLGAGSVPPGVETPDTIELRKKKVESDLEG